MSTPTTRLRLELQALGAGLNTWGVQGLNGIFNMLDDALGGVKEITLTGNHTLPTTNYTTNESRFRNIKFIGSPASAPTVTIPATENWFLMENACGQEITISNSVTTATLGNGLVGYVRTNGGSTLSVLLLPDAATALTIAPEITNGNLPAVAGEITPTNNLASVAGKVTEIGRLGTTAAVADLAALGGTQEVASLNALSPRAADIETLADIEDGTTATNSISNLAPKAADITTLAPRAADIETLAHIEDGTVATTAISDLAPRASDIQNLAPREGDLNTLGSKAADIETLAHVEDGTVATNAISNLGPRAQDLQDLAPRASDLQDLGPRAADIQALAPREGDLNTLSSKAADIGTLADIEDGTTATNAISNLGPRASDIQALAPRANDLQTLGTAPLPTEIATVAGIDAAVSSVANSEDSINSFGKSYSTGAGTINTRGDGTGAAPATGDLRFNQTTSKMVVYDGSSWVAAGSAVNGTSARFSYTATASQTTFPSSGSIDYDAGFADVYLNGVKLQNGTDVTVTSGTNVVLASGAAVGDIVDIVAYGSFNVADTYTQAQSDARYVQPAGAVANISGGAAMGVLYQSATDTTAHLAAGTSGYILQTNGTGSAPTWVPKSSVASPTGIASIMKFT